LGVGPHIGLPGSLSGKRFNGLAREAKLMDVAQGLVDVFDEQGHVV